MRISTDRFNKIIDGSATNLTSMEILIRQEAFAAERHGQDPSVAVEAKLPHVTIIKRDRVKGPIPPVDVSLARASTVARAKNPPATNTQSLFDRVAERLSRLRGGTLWVTYAVVGAAVIWIAASVNMGGLVAHFIGVTLFGLFIQAVNWFFRKPNEGSKSARNP
jgi:hypothetical protein